MNTLPVPIILIVLINEVFVQIRTISTISKSVYNFSKLNRNKQTKKKNLPWSAART